MSGVLYVEILQSPHHSKHPIPSAVVFQRSAFQQEGAGDVTQEEHGSVETRATCWELLLATFCSTLCSSYALHHGEFVRIHHPFSWYKHITYVNKGIVTTSPAPQTRLVVDPSDFAFILNPSPTLMLFACLILGCSISSFAHRRQHEDRYQPLIFVLATTASGILGLALGMSANLIMLCLIPWALCLAMASSVAVHWVVKRCTRGTYARIHCCEIGRKKASPRPVKM